MIFKMYDCDFGFTYNGVNYDFEHVDSVTVEDPEKVRLTRGANQKNNVGVVYVEGGKEAKTLTMTLVGIEASMHALLKKIHKQKDRIDCYVISRADGSSKTAKKALISQTPKQMNMDESVDSLNTQIMLESFDVDENHKS